MKLLPYDNDRIPFLKKLMRRGLCLLHMRTCRIDERKPSLLRFIIDEGTDPMRAYDDRPILHIGQGIDHADTLLRQTRNHLRIVDDGTERAGSPVGCGLFARKFDRTLHAIAEAKGFCQKYFHISTTKCPMYRRRAIFPYFCNLRYIIA